MIVHVLVTSDDGAVANVHAIEHEGALWLVPEWIAYPAAGVQMPARIIRPRRQAFLRPPAQPHLAILPDPVPRSVIEGRVPPEQAHAFEVVEAPDIRIALPPAVH